MLCKGFYHEDDCLLVCFLIFFYLFFFNLVNILAVFVIRLCDVCVCLLIQIPITRLTVQLWHLMSDQVLYRQVITFMSPDVLTETWHP